MGTYDPHPFQLDKFERVFPWFVFNRVAASDPLTLWSNTEINSFWDLSSESTMTDLDLISGPT